MSSADREVHPSHKPGCRAEPTRARGSAQDIRLVEPSGVNRQRAQRPPPCADAMRRCPGPPINNGPGGRDNNPAAGFQMRGVHFKTSREPCMKICHRLLDETARRLRGPDRGRRCTPIAHYGTAAILVREKPAYCAARRPPAHRSSSIEGKRRRRTGRRLIAHRPAQPRNRRIAAAISSAWVSRAKWPVSKNCTSASGRSRLNASAPGGRKNGSCCPHTARNRGW